MEAALGCSPDSGSWTTVGIKKAPPSAAHAASVAPPAAAADKQRAQASPAQAARPADALLSAPAAGQQRAGTLALAAPWSHTVSTLKAQVDAMPISKACS